MTEPGIRTQHLIAQLMVPMNRLLYDVNQALDTETVDEDDNDQNSVTEIHAESVAQSAAGTGSVPAIQRHTMNGQESGLASGQKEYVHHLTTATVPETVQDGESSDKHNAVSTRGSRPAVSPAASIVSADEIRTAKQMRNTTDPVKSAEAGQKISLQKRTEPLAEVSATESPLADTTGIPQNILHAEVLSDLEITESLPVMQSSQSQEDALVDATSSAQESYSRQRVDEKFIAEPVVALNRIRLRPRTTNTSARVDDRAAVATPGESAERLLGKTGEQPSTTMQAALAPRSIQGQSSRITQGIDPVLERAHQISNDAFDQEALNDDSEMMSASRVQNTFNVNVSMNQDSSPDREILQATLLEMLRTAARRQGLEV